MTPRRLLVCVLGLAAVLAGCPSPAPEVKPDETVRPAKPAEPAKAEGAVAAPAKANAPDREAPAKPAEAKADATLTPEQLRSEEEKELAQKKAAQEKAAAEAKKNADAEKKAAKKKEAPIAKSSILLDVKAWDDTVDLEALAAKIKSNQRDGLLWGAHKLAPVAFGVKKLQLLMVIEDEKVSSEDIEELIMQYEDEVQSMDVVAWNKV